MPERPKNRAEAERHINSLYGWSRRHHGPIYINTDRDVIEVAWSQLRFEAQYGLDPNKMYVHSAVY